MNVQDIFKLAIDMGVKSDFRSKEKIAKKLKEKKINTANFPKIRKNFLTPKK